MNDATPDIIEPTRNYLGFVCWNCQARFPIIGPLSPDEFPPGKPLTLKVKGALTAECPQCRHKADYRGDELIRFEQ